VRTPALIKAQDKYEEKRKNYRLPSIYLSEEQFKLFNQAMEKFGGSKKGLIVHAIKRYLEK
jgi:hypothetical protein